MERRRAIAWAGSVSLTACVGALALGSFVGGFGFDAPQSPPAPHAARPQVPQLQVPEPQIPEPQIPQQPAGPELMPQAPQRRPSSGNAHKAPQSDSVAAAPTAVAAPAATPHVDNHPRALAGHRKAGAAVPVPPPDAKPARDVALRDVAWMDVLAKDRRFSWARDLLAILRDVKRSTARSSGTHAGSAEHHVSGQDDGHDD